MAHRIEVISKGQDSRAKVLQNYLNYFNSGKKISQIKIIDVYIIDKNLSEDHLKKTAELVSNPVIENYLIDQSMKIGGADWALEIGFLPGVTDNVAHTVKEEIEGLLSEKFETQEGVYSSRLFLILGNLSKSDIEEVAFTMHNSVIQRFETKPRNEYEKNNGMGIVVPKVRLDDEPKAIEVDLEVPDEELIKIGKSGIKGSDGTRHGPLALDLESMHVIRDYFKKQGRKPIDIELESIAQTWSEHCKHTIFAATLDEIKDGLYKDYIKKATEEIRKKKGKKDICLSVFTDNSGAIKFDDEYMITDKAETHNSPSALDPFGGAITGIVGVNRDTIGFGIGAKPVINLYGFCFADPKDIKPLYKAKNGGQKMLSPKKIMEGIIEGVNVGGNCSGIPTPQGFVTFDNRYKGKPLVFVGTIGLMPKKVKGNSGTDKKARPRDLVVMIGGRVGQDGIHGATFSSEAMDSGSPATAVQIGDPITQKKLSDAIVKEARDLGLYTSITDNGAGGLSCSVAEMVKECGGCKVELEKVPLKYPGLEPWQTWISESQERMTLAVPKEKWDKFSDLMKKRGVEATVIGEFTDSGRCVVSHNGKVVMDIEMEFLHDGLPHKTLASEKQKVPEEPVDIPEPKDLTGTLRQMLGRLNICSFEFISTQYDHEVQGGSVLKPLQGKGRVNAEASVARPLLSSPKGVITSQGVYPYYSELNAYNMAACAIDTAIRNAICAGANLDHLALMDNFCWCSSDEPERLGQLKEAVRACYDYSTVFETPFISGKDSMFNDFKGYDENDEPVKISVPPTLLISSIGVMNDSTKAVSLDVKMPGDLIYVLGKTNDELGGSEYTEMNNADGGQVPKVDAIKATKLYRALADAIEKRLVASAISITKGGLGVALAKMLIAGQLGADIDLSKAPNEVDRDDTLLFSESQSRIVVTIGPKNKEKFEKLLSGNDFALIGKVNNNDSVQIKGLCGDKLNVKISDLEKSYKETLRDY